MRLLQLCLLRVFKFLQQCNSSSFLICIPTPTFLYLRPSFCVTILFVIDRARISYHVPPNSPRLSYFISFKISISASTTTPSEKIPALVPGHTSSPHNSYPSASQPPQTPQPNAPEPQSPTSSTSCSHSTPPTVQPTSPPPHQTTQPLSSADSVYPLSTATAHAD